MPPATQVEAVLAQVDKDFDASIDRLFTHLRMKSVSADPAHAQDCAAMARQLAADIASIGFEAEVRPTGDLPALTERLLEQSALDALAMAGKAGLALHGAAKVENALSRGQAVAILHAKDGAEDGKRKINAYLRGGSADLPVIEAFSVKQLDLALGRANVVHAALLAGPATTTFVARASRLARFCAPDGQSNHGAPRADA